MPYDKGHALSLELSLQTESCFMPSSAPVQCSLPLRTPVAIRATFTLSQSISPEVVEVSWYAGAIMLSITFHLNRLLSDTGEFRLLSCFGGWKVDAEDILWSTTTS